MRFNESMLRLYAITDRSWLGERTLRAQVEDALKGGATCVQLREKNLDFDAFLAEAWEISGLCHEYGVPLIINDNVEIALRIGADGVHVGQGDMLAADARRALGPDKIVGVTAKTVDQAVAARRAGADYLGSGAIFGSTTKLNAKPMQKETLQAICASAGIPVVAIGGIHRGNLRELAGAGIAGVAVVSGIFAAADIEGECRALRAIVEEIIGH